MTWQIAVGAMAALVTWAVLVTALSLVGRAPALLSQPRQSLTSWRVSMWWGLLIMTISVLIMNLLVPLRSTEAAIGLIAVMAIFAVLGLYVSTRVKLASKPRSRTVAGVATRVMIAVLALGMVYMAVAALGPVTNYDTGLYHIGAVKYSGDFATIPGIANLMNPIGYNNSLFPMAAALGNGPWDGVGYRLINGLLMAMMATDLVLRLMQRCKSVGTYILLVGVLASWIPLIALSDYWVISPTSDSAVMILTLVAVAYLADAIQRRDGGQRDGLVAIIVSVLIVSMRPTMVFFLCAVVLVVVIRALRTRAPGSRMHLSAWAVGVLLSLLLLGVQAVRDYRLSGWLEYPLSIYPFNVPWLAADPVNLRTATLGAARDPENLWEAAKGWGWIPVWSANALTQWETYFFLGLLVVAIALVVLARRATQSSPRLLLVTLIPSLISVAAWWLASPPSYRFIWGSLFSLALIPIGWAIHSLARSKSRIAGMPPLALVSALGSVGLLVLIAYCSLARLDVASISESRDFKLGPVSVDYAVTPIPVPPTAPITMSTGLVIQVPTQSDQCWDVYPLCASGMGGSVGTIGESIQDGFTH
jgi:hypothetical protein